MTRSALKTVSLAVSRHWYLYVFEAAELAIFMFAACAMAVVFFDPAWWPADALPSSLLRQSLFALVMGVVAVWIIRSPMGRRSGAHFNPACTLTYLRLGRIAPVDAAFYILAHFVGAIGGVGLAALAFGSDLALPSVDYAVSVPGPYGTAAAFGAELTMAILFMGTVLWTANNPALSKWTPTLVGALIAIFLVVFGPVSGVGLNPARTTGSAVFAHLWTAIWLYLTVPVAGMLIAAEANVRLCGKESVLCAKIAADSQHLCPFNCRYPGHRHWPDADAATPPTTRPTPRCEPVPDSGPVAAQAAA